jgi:hypothetical protein
MGYFKLFENYVNEAYKTADQINRYMSEVTPDESDVPDYFMSLIKKSGKKFELKTVKIKDLLDADKSLEEYVLSGEIRYGENGESEYEPFEDELDNPIVVFNGEVVDGYSRTSTLYHRDVKTIQAWVSL